MKKTLLLSSFAIFGLMANAQTQYWTEATAESLEAAGLSSDKVPIDGGTVFATGEAGTIALAFEDSWGTTAPCGDYKNVKVGNVELTLSNGAVGNANPNGNDFSYDSGKGFFSGAVFEIVPKKDGWVTVFTKMSPNKNYIVMEGKTGAMSYTLGYSNGTDKIYYTIPYDPETYYIDFNAPDIDKYVIDGAKPQTPQLVGGYEENPGNQTGFLTFNVVADNSYYFGAFGSKAPCGAFVLTEGDEEPVVTFLANEDKGLEEVVFGDDSGAVEAIEAAQADPNAPVYNLLGVKVDASYKGVVIKNGKKYIQK